VALTVLVLAGAVGVAMFAGGRWSRLAHLPVSGRSLVAAAVLAQVGGAVVGVAGFADPRRSYVVGLAVSAVCALAFCARNLRLAGVALVTGGLALNALAVGLNGAMPVSIVAAYRARVPIGDIADGSDPRHDIAGTGTQVRWLGDVIPVPLPWRPEVVSAGDVLVTAGLGELVVAGMMGSAVYRRRHRHGEEGA
jgi:hypothetical protein